MAKKTRNTSSRKRGGPPSSPTRTTPEREPRESEDAIELEGTVLEQLRNATFRVQLDNGLEVLAYTAGKMRKFRIRIMPGDKVLVAVSPYDFTRGRIVYRHR